MGQAADAGAGRAWIVFDRVTVTYRGAKYEIGRGLGFYGVWTAGGARSQPLERWPETPEGWTAAWSRFVSIEAPGTIVPVGRNTPPVAPAASRDGGDTGPFGEGTAPTAETGGTVAAPAGPVPYTPYGQYTPRATPVLGGKAARIVAAALLGAGIVLGVAGLFPAYIGAASLAQQADQVTSHAIYLAVWTVSAVLILLGGARLRIGALLGLGLSAVTFGLFLADAGTALSASGNTGGGAGLVLSIIGWLACAVGSVVAFLARPASAPAPAARPAALARPRGAAIGPAVMVVLAGLGTAAAFAPAWDSFTLRTAAGQVQSLTAGNAFSNPGLVLAGDVAVMIALVAVVIAAALWRPVRHGAVLLAGATAAMAAQAISALVQVTGTPVPAQFGISSAQASQLGLTISAGLTPAFWIYLGFLLALIVSCVWMLFAPHSVPVAPAQGYGPRPDDSADDSADESADGREPADSAAAAAAGARDGEGSAG
jgi:hypothetical protein